MTGDSSNVGYKEARPALGDMTNLPNKRGISSILGDFLLKSGDESGKTVMREESGVKFSKRLCLVVEDLVKESCRGSVSNSGSSSSEDKDCSGGSPVIDDSENVERTCGEEPGKSKDALKVSDVGVESSKDDAVEIAGTIGHVLKESCTSNSSEQIRLENVEKDCGQSLNVASNPNQCDVTCEDIAKSVFSNQSESGGLLLIEENKTTDEQGLPYSQNQKSFAMSRCSTIDRMGHVNHDMNADLLKSCSCSFCLKAAYIWSDLHYQDIKGRLSVLKKSQKEANNLIQRNSRTNPIDFHGSATSTSSTKLESDLMSQWKSLFMNMGDILSRESNQLQKSFASMKELRDSCKMDLERSTKTPQE